MMLLLSFDCDHTFARDGSKGLLLHVEDSKQTFRLGVVGATFASYSFPDAGSGDHTALGTIRSFDEGAGKDLAVSDETFQFRQWNHLA